MSNVTTLHPEPPSTSGSMALLQLAARDNSLAAELTRNPKATLEMHGIFLSEQDIPVSVSLPSTEAMRKAAVQCGSAQFDQGAYAGFFGGFGD